MRIGLNGGGHERSLAAIRAQARTAAEDGFASYWLSQITGPDALTALAIVGSETPRIELGVSIVPIYGRHPIALAIAALTAQQATGGRLVLGVGVSHRAVVEGVMGLRYERSYSYAREYLAILKPLLAGEPVNFAGGELTTRTQLAIDGVATPPIVLAALGPRMLELAGREADGCTTWMVGEKTLREYVVPSVRRAADAAKRPCPRIVVGLPVCVTRDPEAARRFARNQLAVYGTLPVYGAMLEREGAAGPEDLLMTGDEDEVRERIAAIAAAGGTELRAAEVCATPDDALRTRALLRSLLADRRVAA
jgi:F420-dependent oxidoreductase-like protein